MVVCTQEALAEEDLICLVMDARKGDEDALQQIFSYFHQDISNMLQHNRVPHHDRPDMVQECFLRILRCISAYVPRRGSFKVYVVTSLFRFTKSWNGAPMDCVEDIPPLGYEHDFTSIDVGDLLEFLPASQRTIVESYFGFKSNEKTLVEIAVQQRMTPKQVRTELTEALYQLREQIQ